MQYPFGVTSRLFKTCINLFCTGLLAALFLVLTAAHLSAQSKWAFPGPDGRLVYAHTEKGDHIPDFSYAGYEGGGVALPAVPAKRTVAPSGSDDTTAIQAAIDAVSALPLVGGFRGAVELAPGTFRCEQTLTISASGVVLRGAGLGDHGTTIVMTGTPHLALHIAGQIARKYTGPTIPITDPYVPVGSSVLHVADASRFHPGDTIRIRKPVTPAWVHFMGMDDLERPGREEHWVGGGRLDTLRRIAAVDMNAAGGNTLTLEVPLMDSYDSQFFEGSQAEVHKVELPGRIDHVGLEYLRIVAPKRSIAFGDPSFDGLVIDDTADSWVRSVAWEETTQGVRVNNGSARITFLECDVTQRVPVTSHAKPTEFACNGTQILFDRCTGSGDRTLYFATEAREQGPVVVLHCRFRGNGAVAPHQRWSTGLLVDNCEVPGGSIEMMNRGEMGSGHGWAIGWAVVWNSSAHVLAMNTPPGSMIWSIGNRGAETNPPFPSFDERHSTRLAPATIESSGKPVQPQSLYLAQLRERLGDQAVKNVGY
jgi:hypothetical protein